MAKNDTNKSDGPICACGKEDLYEVWLKNQKTKKEDLSATKKENKDKSVS